MYMKSKICELEYYNLKRKEIMTSIIDELIKEMIMCNRSFTDYDFNFHYEKVNGNKVRVYWCAIIRKV